jgi:hypothetical protein
MFFLQRSNSAAQSDAAIATGSDLNVANLVVSESCGECVQDTVIGFLS